MHLCAIQMLVFCFLCQLHKSGCVFDPTRLLSIQPESAPEQDVSGPIRSAPTGENYQRLSVMEPCKAVYCHHASSWCWKQITCVSIAAQSFSHPQIDSGGIVSISFQLMPAGSMCWRHVRHFPMKAWWPKGWKRKPFSWSHQMAWAQDFSGLMSVLM